MKSFTDMSSRLNFNCVKNISANCSLYISNASFVIGIDSMLVGRIATSMSEERGYSVSIKKGQMVWAKLCIEDLMLKPGQYFLTVGIRGIKGGMDHLESALSFQITSLLYDENKVPTEKWGIIYITPKWHIFSDTKACRQTD